MGFQRLELGHESQLTGCRGFLWRSSRRSLDRSREILVPETSRCDTCPSVYRATRTTALLGFETPRGVLVVCTFVRELRLRVLVVIKSSNVVSATLGAAGGVIQAESQSFVTRRVVVLVRHCQAAFEHENQVSGSRSVAN